MAKPAIATEVNIALKLFTAPDRDAGEELLCMFKSASLDPTGVQSLKAKAFFDSGEWNSKDKLQICLIAGSHCNRRICSNLIFPSGVDNFGGKDLYTIASHLKAQVHILKH